MLNTEKMTLTTVSVKDYSTVEISVIIPNNVIDVNYFEYACQYHAYNNALEILESEEIKVQYEDVTSLDSDPQTALALHDANMSRIHDAQNILSDIVKKFMDNIGEDLENMFVHDTFAKTYTSLVTDFDTVYRVNSSGKRTRAEKTPTRLYKRSGNIRSNIDKLEKLIDRMLEENVPKAEKSAIFTPLVNEMMDAFGVSELNGGIYKNPTFKNIPNKYWSCLVKSLRKSGGKIANGSILSRNKIELIYKSLLALGLAKMGVVEIPDYSTPVERSLDALKEKYIKKEDAKK